MSKFKVYDTFRLSGRNCLCLIGDIEEGTMKNNDIIHFASREFPIKGIEGVRSLQPGRDVGIVIQCKDENEMNELKELEWIGSSITIKPKEDGKNN